MSDDKKRRSLVLGRGLIGSYLADFLIEEGEEVRILSRGDGHDLRESENYIDDFEWADRVWFVAWDAGSWKQKADSDLLESNLELCQSVFRVLEKTGTPFLFVSSQAAPSSTMIPMGVAKRVGEMWTQILGGHTARLWNVYGWEPVGEKSHIIPDLVWKGLQGEDIELMTDGKEMRQFLYVRDCAEALVHQFDIGQKHADVTSGKWIPVKDIAELVGKKLGVKVSPGTDTGRAPLYEPEVFLESWEPRTSLDEGLDEIIEKAKEWQKKNH